MDIIENLKTLLAQGQDNSVLHFSLGNAYLNEKKYPQAIKHFFRALELNPEYSVAWKLYGKALTGNSQIDEAIIVYEKGILVAEKKGDIQAAKEMKVFLKRLKKQQVEGSR
ncbi:MAG: tetratricopeptide repeat protein [Gammaproteobacteria bacterium]|nr:tetratricopeptide repeat protein [Gammaproteobacteria bacterium]